MKIETTGIIQNAKKILHVLIHATLNNIHSYMLPL